MDKQTRGEVKALDLNGAVRVKTSFGKLTVQKVEVKGYGGVVHSW